MELFVVNRYDGDVEKKSNDSHDHLAELLTRIEERKKERAHNINNDTSKINDNDIKNNNVNDGKQLSHRGKKRKKLSIDDNKSKQIDNKNNINESIDKLELIINNNESNNINETIVKTINDKQHQQQQNFMILGETTQKKKEIVKRILPKWLANPEIISADVNNGPILDEFINKLDSQLIERLRSNGINKLFPVQASLINWMLKCNNERKLGWWPRDTCVSAPTGSGKTLAYVLPIIQSLKRHFVRKIRCLIVLPVHELANQVHSVIVNYSAHTNLRVGLITGAASLEADQIKLVKKSQRGEFISRVDIIVATPGRLIDHIEKSAGFSLEYLEYLIIDEADRATEWLKYIPMPHRSSKQLTINNYKSNYLIPPAQKLLFSATLSQDPEKLSRLGLFQPILFTSVLISGKDGDIDLDKEIGDYIGRYTIPNELTERAIECSAEYKPICLIKLLVSDEYKDGKSLIFTNSGESAHRLTILLQSILKQYNIDIDELSSKMIPKHRAQVLKKFQTGQIQVLVSSDALARGLDITGIKLVVSYDLPKHIKGYIHRAGRTGRAGLNGTAISILTFNQIGAFNRMLLSAHKELPTIERIESIEIFAETINYESHLEKLKETLDNEQVNDIERLKASKPSRFHVNKK